MLKHQRKCSIKDNKGTGDDSFVNVRNLRKCSDKLKQNTTNKAKNTNEIDSDINDTDDNIIVQEQVGHYHLL
jgi:ribosome recycling factor